MDYIVRTSTTVPQVEDDTVPRATTPDVPPTEDGYWEKVRKFVPSEILGGWLLIEGFLKQMTESLSAQRLVLGVFLALFAYLTWVASRTQMNLGDFPKQRWFTVGAFLLYVVATGAIVETLSLWQPGFGSVAIIVFGVTVWAYRTPTPAS